MTTLAVTLLNPHVYLDTVVIMGKTASIPVVKAILAAAQHLSAVKTTFCSAPMQVAAAAEIPLLDPRYYIDIEKLYIFNVLKERSSRYVFVQGNKKLFRLPFPEPFDAKQARLSTYTGQLRAVKKGLLVQVFENPYFGWLGRVHSVQEDSVHVTIDGGHDPVKIKPPNIISLE